MDSSSILPPAVALMLLTLAVWLYMYAVRLAYISKKRIDAQQLASPEQINALLPEAVNRPSNNLKNLCEMPVLFYALCALLAATNGADRIFIAMAWGYVALRAVHSAIHCTVNIVTLRFSVYVLSSVVLWVMVLRLALRLFP